MISVTNDKNPSDCRKNDSSLRHKQSKDKEGRSGVRTKNKAACELAGGIIIYTLCIALSLIIRLYQSKIAQNETDFSPYPPPTSSIKSSSHGPQLTNNESLSGFKFRVLGLLSSRISAYFGSNALSDAHYVVVLSVTMALLRVFIYSACVPKYLAPRRLNALSKCKSTHLLSSLAYIESSKSSLQGMVTTPAEINSEKQNVKSNRFWHKTIEFLRKVVGHNTQVTYENLDVSQTIRLFSAPRYATAIFRLVFCVVSCTWAFFKFRSAPYWPIWIGGQMAADTKTCWDLSGSVSIGISAIDSDFDQKNSDLRYFFLTQASYQLHSICFQILSMILLFIYGGNDRNERLSSLQDSLRVYLRPFLEHLMYFILIMGSFIFSGFRRIGAIGIFSLELSSCLLHILQVCINAPETSFLKNTYWIKFLYHCLVIPTFVYCRFFVLPFVVQFSAAFESHQYLQQLERALVPGCGLIIFYFFNGLLVVTFLLNCVYLRRLCFHPYIHQLKLIQEDAA